MPQRQYSFEPGGEKRLAISWKGFWKEITVTLDGNPVGTIADQKALIAGQDFQLPDGSSLHVQYVQKFYGAELAVARNGQPLPESDSNPLTRLKTAYILTYVIAGLNLLMGVLAYVFEIEFLQDMGVGFFNLIYGVVFLVLASFIQRRSSFALILAVILFALDGILGVVFTAMSGQNPGITGIFVRILILIPMCQGVGAIKALKRKTE